MIRTLFFLSLALLSLTGRGSDCESKLSKEEMRDLILETKESYFSEDSKYDLSSVKVKIEEFISSEYFLQTDASKFIFGGNKENNHVIQINKKLFQCPPSQRGLKAILAHELMHIYDYKTRTLLGLGWDFATDTAEYERHTDFRVLQMGLAQGLSEYRRWIYQRIKEQPRKRVLLGLEQDFRDGKRRPREKVKVLETEAQRQERIKKQLELKKKNYYTPQEILELFPY